ncbi:S8 family serine peptidase, partial [Streptomyces sp. SID5770]|nr:S8 family serine peptidase [Streptomyces sp. SID5770]
TLRPGVSPKSFANSFGVTPENVYTNAFMGFSAPLSSRQLEALRRSPEVDSIEQNGYLQLSDIDIPDIQLKQKASGWGLDRIDDGMPPVNYEYDGEYVYDPFPSGNGVDIYIIDTGIETTHPEFNGRATNDYNVTSGSASDCHGHGTKVASAAGGKTVGIARNARLHGVKVAESCTTGQAESSDL